MPILGLDVNASSQDYRVERDETGRLGIRVALADVKGISSEEVARIVAGAPYGDLEDFWRRARVSLPVLERLVLAGAFDALYGLDPHRELGRRGRLTRRDLLLHVAELDRWGRAVDGPPEMCIRDRGYPTYFLTVATVVDLIRDRGVRVAARGSGAGSMVNYLLGISGVEPLAHDLLMERFCTPLRAQLPDIDIDTESARRTEIYEAILARSGGDRVTCCLLYTSRCV